MIEELAAQLPDFSVVNHTRCFLHVTNLVAKSIVKQFDVKKADADGQLNAAEAELHKIADGLELEEALAAAERGDEENDAGGGEFDDNDGWVDEVAMLSDEERADLEVSIRPVKLVLAKVSDQPHLRSQNSPETHLSFAKLPSRLFTLVRSWVQHGKSASKNVACL